MRVIFVNRYFHPDLSATSEMLSELAFALSDRGRPVTIITSRLRYENAASSLFTTATPFTVCKSIAFGHHSSDVLFLWDVALTICRFSLLQDGDLCQLARAGDVVVAKTDPPLLSVMAAAIARLKGSQARELAPRYLP